MKNKIKKVKKWLYRGLMSSVVGLMSLTNMTLPTRAASGTLTYGAGTGISYRMSGPALEGNLTSDWNDNYPFLYLDGDVVFCVDPSTIAVDGGTGYEPADFSRSLIKKMNLIALHGYYEHGRTAEWYMASQFMIWEARGWSVNSTNLSNYASMKSQIQNAIDHHYDKPYFGENSYTINANDTLTLTDQNGVVSEFDLDSVAGVNISTSGNTLSITPTVDAPDSFTLSGERYVGESSEATIVYRPKYNTSQAVSSLDKNDPVFFNITVKVNKYGKVRIAKTDETNNKGILRAGVEYEIYNAADNSLVSTIASNANGIAESGLLLFGNYYYVEKKAPEKYLVNEEPHYFTIDKAFTSDEFTDSTITETPVYGDTEITKLDKENGSRKQGDATLEGAVYGLYAAENIYDPTNDGTVIYTKDKEVTRKAITNGKAKAVNLPLGKYYWKEISEPDGYLKDTKPHEVDLRYKDQKTAEVEVDAESYEPVKKQAFQIIKLTTPGTSGETLPLNGAEFTYMLKSYVKKYGSFEAAVNVAETNDGRILASEWGRMTTDDKGYAKSKELPYGEYVVRETVVPANHTAVDDFSVKITKDSREPQTYRYFIDEVFRSKLAVVKTDKETGQTVALSHMRFKVKALTKTTDFEAGEYVGYWAWNPLPHYVNEWTTGEDGTVMLEMSLKAGTYQIEEIESPDGYLLNHEPLKFTIRAGWQTQLGPDQETIITTVVFKDEPVKGQVQIDKEADLFKGYQSEMTEYGELFTPVYEKGMLAGAKFEIKAKTDIVGMDGTTWYHAGDVVETLTSDGENLTTSSLLPIGTEGNNIYSVQEVETAEGYVVDSTVHDFRFDYVDEETDVVAPTWLDENGNAAEAEATIAVNNEKQTMIAVASKAMEAGIFNHEEAYQNVTFGIYADEVDDLEKDSLVSVAKVDDQGQITSGSISRAGSYYLQEIATDDQYVLDDTKYPFTYEYNGDQVQTITVNDGVIVNKLKRATLEIIKYTDDDVFYSEAEQAKIAAMGKDKSDAMRDDRLADDHNYLAFSEFELATDKAFTNIIQTGTTDITGRLVFEDLELGTYYVREKGSADFYEINDEVNEITLTKDHQFETIEVKNDLIESHIDIKKVDTEDQTKTLANAEFTMYADEECSEALEAVKTDEKGIARFDDIKFGTTVYIKETSAPTGYQLSDEIVKVTIDEDWVNGDDQTRTIEVKDDLILSYVDIKKVDADDHTKTLANAEFTMYADEECSEAVKTVKTDEKGIARFDDIKFGTTVYIKETSAPTGYQLSDEIVKVMIDEDWIDGDDQTRIVEVVNYLIPKSPNTGSNVDPWMFLGLVGISAFVLAMLSGKKKEAE